MNCFATNNAFFLGFLMLGVSGTAVSAKPDEPCAALSEAIEFYSGHEAIIQAQRPAIEAETERIILARREQVVEALRKKAVPPRNFSEAKIYYGVERSALSVVSRPKLKPDAELYEFSCNLVAADLEKGIAQCDLLSDLARYGRQLLSQELPVLTANPGNSSAFARFMPHTEPLELDDLSLNTTYLAIGYYKDNSEIMVSGRSTLAPIFDLIYFADSKGTLSDEAVQKDEETLQENLWTQWENERNEHLGKSDLPLILDADARKRRIAELGELSQSIGCPVRVHAASQVVERADAQSLWSKKIIESIRSNWQRPRGANDRFNCLVEIEQIPGGEVISARVVQSCGNAVLDRSVENAVRKASPLPPPPHPSLFERRIRATFCPDFDAC